jgi:hypothetical protein
MLPADGNRMQRALLHSVTYLPSFSGVLGVQHGGVDLGS